jgi:hypothetical protein
VNEERPYLTPGVAQFVAAGCVAFGVLMFLSGAAMLVFALVNAGSSLTGMTSFFLSAIGALAGSFLWFALGSIVALLSRIEENTRAERES